MITKEIKLKVNGLLAQHYLEDFDRVSSFYQYNPYKRESWQERKNWLDHHPCHHREKLARGLKEFNQQIENSPASLENIEKLKQENTYVIIGGQQAGVLTGPLYSIYKAITIIQLAKQKERELGCSVVPVFWIAGEDHDFDEVNHVYSMNLEQNGIEKISLNMPGEENKLRRSVSHRTIPREVLTTFIDDFFAMQPDGPAQPEMRRELMEMAEKSQTLVDFFARIMARLFFDEGLILVDSALPFVRELEQPLFQTVIEQNEKLADTVVEQRLRMEEAGYQAQVEVEKDQAHFFIYHDGERILLSREGDLFVSRDGVLRFRREQLTEMLEQDPARFSANVVTRPLMQEYLFPTLGFVGGPGEIAYWGLYKSAFSLMNLQMPLIIPRISITLLDPKLVKWMDRYCLSWDDLQHEIESLKQEWMLKQNDSGLSDIFAEVRRQLTEIYRPLKQELAGVEKGLEELSERNLQNILKEVGYLEKKSVDAYRKKYRDDLERIDHVKQWTMPMDKPQERVYNIFSFLNKYGPELIDQLLKQPMDANGVHKCIYL